MLKQYLDLMRKIFLLFAFCTALKGNSQDYLISFSGTGASITVSTVKVENLTKSISLSMSGSDVLRLTGSTTGINSIEDYHSSNLKIYPNPMSESSTLEIYVPVEGDAIITILDITGKPMAKFQSYLEKFRQDFRLSGLGTGFYIVNVQGNNYHLSGKMVGNVKTSRKINIEKISSISSTSDNEEEKKIKKGLLATIDMAYSTGDRLKFTGTSGNFSTVKIDMPTSDKTISFNFMPCTDGDNNNYPVVEIGTQVWMGENLKTTKYNNGTLIPLETDTAVWAGLSSPGYCWFNNDALTYKDKYGALYNWFTVDAASNEGKNICPSGWHVPSFAQWMNLSVWLVENGYAYENANSHVTKALAATTGWYPSSNGGAPGNDPTGNNSTGFTGLPTEGRVADGRFIGNLGNRAEWWSSSLQGSFARSIVMLSNYPVINYTNGGYFEKENGVYVRCLKGELIIPTITSSSVSSITENSAICGGNIVSDNGDPVTARGVCWSKSPKPTSDGNNSVDGTGTGQFTSIIYGLEPGTTYYVRAYATNSSCTTYGNEISFSTTVTDIDGNVYHTVSVGTQLWMVENLKTTRYRNGDLIGSTSPATLDIRSESAPKYQWASSGNEINASAYGRLYTWYSVEDSRYVCPRGWHVPIDAEWTILTDYLGGLGISGGKLKDVGYAHWLSPNTGATNETGFTALPAGYRLSSGVFGGFRTDGLWWSLAEVSTTDAWTLGMGNSYIEAYGGNNAKNSGYSVRCLRDF